MLDGHSQLTGGCGHAPRTICGLRSTCAGNAGKRIPTPAHMRIAHATLRNTPLQTIMGPRCLGSRSTPPPLSSSLRVPSAAAAARRRRVRHAATAAGGQMAPRMTSSSSSSSSSRQQQSSSSSSSSQTAAMPRAEAAAHRSAPRASLPFSPRNSHCPSLAATGRTCRSRCPQHPADALCPQSLGSP